MQAQVIELAERSTEHIAADLHCLLPHVAIDIQPLQDRRCAGEFLPGSHRNQMGVQSDRSFCWSSLGLADEWPRDDHSESVVVADAAVADQCDAVVGPLRGALVHQIPVRVELQTANLGQRRRIEQAQC